VVEAAVGQRTPPELMAALELVLEWVGTEADAVAPKVLFGLSFWFLPSVDVALIEACLWPSPALICTSSSTEQMVSFVARGVSTNCTNCTDGTAAH